jgi:hypothetical protein
MANMRNSILYAVIGIGSLCLIAGVFARNWLKSKIVEAGSPEAFAAQSALSGLERKIKDRLGGSIAPDQREKLQQTILHLRGQSSHFDQTKTIALFTILSEFDQRTKIEQGQPSHESVGMLLTHLEALFPIKDVPHGSRKEQSSVTGGLTPSSTRTPPALPSALSQHLASSASFGASVQAGPVSFLR